MTSLQRPRALARWLATVLVVVPIAGCGAAPPATQGPPTGCRVEVAPLEEGPAAQLRGSGFPADSPATLTIVGPPDPGAPFVLDQVSNPALRSDVRGVVLFTLQPTRDNIGTSTLELSAGGCIATTSVTLDESAFPPACPEGEPAPDAAASAAYSALILADAPIAYWRFEDDAASPIATADIGPAAAISGAAALGGAGVAGRGIGIRPGGQVAIEAIELGGDFTIEGWVLLCDDQIDAADGLFAASGGVPNVNFFDAAPRFWTGDEDLIFAEDGFLTHGRWYHLALVRSDGLITLAVDGTSVGTAPFADPIDIASLGDSGGSEASGQLDEVAIYDHALSLEVLADHDAAAR